MISAYLGLGSNLGDRARYLRDAVDRVRALPGVRVMAVSPVYETKPVGRVDQPDFLNLVVAVETTRSPRELLDACLAIEHVLGRTRGLRWGPRTLDIDLLLFGDLSLAAPDLTVPHPRLRERAFVLVPLADLAPDRCVGPDRISDLAATIDRSGVQKVGDAIEQMV